LENFDDSGSQRAHPRTQRLRRSLNDMLVIGATIFTAEALVMFGFAVFPPGLGELGDGFLDATLLTLLSTPALWLLRGGRAPEWTRDLTPTAAWTARRVRFLTFGAVLLFAAAAAFQGLSWQRIEEASKLDFQNLASARKQHALGEHMVRLAHRGDTDPAELATLMRESRSDFGRVEAELAPLWLLYGGKRQAPDLDVQHRDTFIWLSESFAAALERGDAAEQRRLRAELVGEADAFLDWLVAQEDLSQLVLMERRSGAADRQSLWHVLSVMMVLLLAVGLAEPMARVVSRQQSQLEHQALELKRVALAAERTDNTVIFSDATQAIVWVNDGFSRTTGFSREEALDRSFGELLLARSEATDAVRQFREATAAHRPVRVELLCSTRDGGEIWLDVDAQPLFDDAGNPAGHVAIATDVTAQANQRRYLATLLETLPVGMTIADTAGRIVDCNQAAERIYGLSREALLGLDIELEQRGAAVIVDGQASTQEHPARATLRSGEPVNGAVLNIRAPGHGSRWIRVHTQALRHAASERITGVLSCFEDITAMRLQQGRLALMIDGVGLGTWEWNLADGSIVCSDQFHALLGPLRPKVRTDMAWWRGLIHPEDLDSYGVALADHVEGRVPALAVELRMRCADGSHRWMSVIGKVQERDADGRALWMAGVLMDVNRVRVAEAEARTQLEQTRAALSGLDAYRTALDQHSIVAVSDASDRIRYVNDMFCRVTGYAREEIIGRDHRMFSSGLHPREYWAGLWQRLLSGGAWHGEICNRRKDGQLYWIDTVVIPMKDASGRVVEFVAVHADVTERKRLEESLRTAALTDPLTRLPNRASVMDALQRALARAARNPDYHFAVLFLDFDRFKVVNDSLGHQVGDELLRQIAERLHEALRSTDVLARVGGSDHLAARLGGDEFVLLIDGIHTVADAERVAQRLLETLGRPYRLGEHEVQSTASIGIVTSDDIGGDPDSLLRNADIAMYEAKRAGKGRYVLFDATMHQRVAQGLGFENDLRRALAGGGITVAYQPIVDLETGRVEGVEALARWHCPTRGTVPPIQFIAAAEESGLIGTLGAHVLQLACRDMAHWRRVFGGLAPETVSVNVSRSQLLHRNLVASVGQALNEQGLPPFALRLEVTETLSMQGELALDTLHGLKALGVKLALDDFGTGYSSLASLHSMPVDVLKIDRSFVAEMLSSDYHRVLIEAAVLVARVRGVATIAEGVETEAQAAALRALRCRMAQGNFVSLPLNAADFESWYGSHLQASGQREPFDPRTLASHA
jgi:diguanylate cyclase (GGDEF)-like protein/PAS domain S-box-containing protein